MRPLGPGDATGVEQDAEPVVVEVPEPVSAALHAFHEWRAAELSRPAAMLFTELMDLAPVSASDQRLLERLGWTRTRRVAGLQATRRGRPRRHRGGPDGPGRPRKLYAPNERYHAVEQAGDLR